MRRARFFMAVLAVVCCARATRAARLDGSVFLLPIDESQFSSWGSARYLNDLNSVDYSAVLSGEHSVNGPAVFEVSVSGNGIYSYDLEGPAEPGACYGTTLHVIGDPDGTPPAYPTFNRTWTGDTKCARSGPIEISQTCPLILDLNSDGIHTTGLDDPVHFWIDLEGRSLATAWTNPQTEEAFLWMDLNHDRAAHVTELFGSRMVAPDGAYHPNGFEALLKFDRPEFGGDFDGQITHRDRVWARLELWVDRNHDGVSQHGETSVPSSHRIVALNLAYSEGETYDEHGNELYLIGSYMVRVPGHDNELRTMADVEFQYIPN